MSSLLKKLLLFLKRVRLLRGQHGVLDVPVSFYFRVGSDQISHLSIKYASVRLFTPYEGGRSLFFVEPVVPPEGGGEDDVRQDA